MEHSPTRQDPPYKSPPQPRTIFNSEFFQQPKKSASFPTPLHPLKSPNPKDPLQRSSRLEHLPMATSIYSNLRPSTTMLIVCSILISSSMVALAGNFYQDFDVIFGDGRVKVLDNGQLVTLSLDKASGSGFKSKNQYLYGKLDMQIKLVPGNSAGTVTTFYLHSDGSTWDEIDLEFLGNLSGDPYIFHTNLYSQGKGNREQQFYLWFDPTADFHTYSVLWNPSHIVYYVDGIPIREFKNLEAAGVAYPKSQPMTLYSTLWDAEDWATRGGLVKTDWSKAPFTASFRGFNVSACVWSNGASSCPSSSAAAAKYPWFSQQLDAASQQKMKSVQQKYMIYDYCKDTKRFPQGLPLECTLRTK